MVYYCEVCLKIITDENFNYSVTRYGKSLCEYHQKSSEKERLRKMFVQSKNVWEVTTGCCKYYSTFFTMKLMKIPNKNKEWIKNICKY